MNPTDEENDDAKLTKHELKMESKGMIRCDECMDFIPTSNLRRVGIDLLCPDCLVKANCIREGDEQAIDEQITKEALKRLPENAE